MDFVDPLILQNRLREPNVSYCIRS